MRKPAPSDPVVFHSDIAEAFDASYDADPNRRERVAVWRACLDRHIAHVPLAYDIGCGSGVLTAELAERADKVIAIDGADGMLTLAKAAMTARGLGHVECVQMRLPIADTSALPLACLVMSSSVIEYLPSVPDALAMLRNLMTADATLIFSISNKSSIARTIVRWVHRLTGRPRYFGLVLHFVNEADVLSLLASAGLALIELIYFGGADRTNRMLAKVFPRKFAANMILVVARRTG